MLPSITAIVCTRNRDRFLTKCLDSLLNQSLPRKDYEILVIDNGSTDKTKDILLEYQTKYVINWLHEPVTGLSRSRNLAWKNVRTDYLGYIDDDATAAPEWLEIALDCFTNVHPQPVWIAGAIHLEWESEPASWMNEELTKPLGRLYLGDTPRFISGSERVVGANCFFTKAFLSEMKGFNEQLGRKDFLLSGEETELKQRAEAKGYSLYYNPHAAIRHFVPRERNQPAWFFRRYFWGGVSDYIQKRSALKNRPNRKRNRREQAVQYSEYGMTERMIRNVIDAFGIASNKDKIIRGRIYWCYVIGFLSGFFYWSMNRKDGR